MARSASLSTSWLRPGPLEARGQVGGVALGNGARRVDPQPPGRLEPGRPQQLAAAAELGPDLAGDARPR